MKECKDCLNHGYFVSGRKFEDCLNCSRVSDDEHPADSAAYLFVKGIEERQKYALTQLALMIDVVSFNPKTKSLDETTLSVNGPSIQATIVSGATKAVEKKIRGELGDSPIQDNIDFI